MQYASLLKNVILYTRIYKTNSRFMPVLASKHLRVYFVNDYTSVKCFKSGLWGIYFIKRFSTIQT